MQLNFNGNRSSEKFEVNGAYLKIAQQIREEVKEKTLEEVIQYLVGKVEGKSLFSKRLKTVSYSIGQMNRIIDAGECQAMVKIGEALQERGIELIAEAVDSRPLVRAVFIAGPSSSGKTTFSKKLSIALEKKGMTTQCLSFDDYYIDREQTPKDENGEYDYEHINAVNVDFFHEQFQDLLDGKEVELPKYDFAAGKSVKSGRRICLTSHTVLIMEGIHALNPILCQGIPPESILRIYISGLTVAKNEDGTYFPTADNRLIRRMVRDAQFRNTDASSTLARWPSVRRGEDKWIVPFQQNADINFCTAFQYELGVLKEKALSLLYEVHADDPAYVEAQRLKWVLNRFHDIPLDYIPPHSLLREFTGGSAFEY